jgi:serine phosphatase RsbU (regulator of sigma subunit)
MIHDGMDVSLCAYNTETKTLEWAGANNPIWIYRNHAASIEELRPTKKAIGRSDEIAVFHNHRISLGMGDRLYLFSDGFADQFGGVDKKKLTKKRFRELILSLQSYALTEQESKLDAFLLEFRNGLEQTDDILVMGVEL